MLRGIALALAMALLSSGCNSANNPIVLPFAEGYKAWQEGRYSEEEKLQRQLKRIGRPWAQFELGAFYLTKGRISEGWRLVCAAAYQGDGDAQNVLGYFYEGRNAIRWPSTEPSPVKPNPVLGHMWYSLAALKGNKEAVFYRDGLAERMTPIQKTNAEKLAKKWEPTSGDCGTR